MGLENLSHHFDTGENKENHYEYYPVKIERFATNELVMKWNKNDIHDPRPSYWETVLINNIGEMVCEDDIKVKIFTVKGYYQSLDLIEPLRWGNCHFHCC